MALDLLLVNPGGTRKKIYQELSNNYAAIEPPFWAAITAGFIRDKGYSVKILDANAENLDIKEAADAIVKSEPRIADIVVYGQQPAASTQLMSGVSPLCREIKAQDKNINISLTGLYPSALPEKTMREEACDFVCEGEGFHTILGLLRKDGVADIPGLWRREGNKTIPNEKAKNIEDLTAELPNVAWDLLPMKKYLAHNWQCLDDLESRTKYAAFCTSLGCPYKCEFCSLNATFGGERKVRFWSPEWALKQIDTLVKDYDIKILRITDELFVLNPHHFIPICDGLIERDYNLNIWAYTRVDTVKDEYLQKLRKAGFKWLCLGIESGSESVRQGVSKGSFNDFDIRKVVQKIKNADISILGNFMFGLPDDDFDSMQKTFSLAQELNCEFPNFYSVMAYPGSKMYDEVVKKGIKLPDSWLGYSQHSYECQPLLTNKISAEDVLRFRDYAFNAYVQNPRYLSMIEEKFGTKARAHVEEMAKHKLKRKLLGD